MQNIQDNYSMSLCLCRRIIDRPAIGDIRARILWGKSRPEDKETNKTYCFSIHHLCLSTASWVP